MISHPPRRFDLDIDVRRLPIEDESGPVGPEQITLRIAGGPVVVLPLGDLVGVESVVDMTGDDGGRLTRLKVGTHAIHRVSMIPVGAIVEAETRLLTSASPEIIPRSGRLRVVSNDPNFKPGPSARQTIVMVAD